MGEAGDYNRHTKVRLRCDSSTVGRDYNEKTCLR